MHGTDGSGSSADNCCDVLYETGSRAKRGPQGRDASIGLASTIKIPLDHHAQFYRGLGHVPGNQILDSRLVPSSSDSTSIDRNAAAVQALCLLIGGTRSAFPSRIRAGSQIGGGDAPSLRIQPNGHGLLAGISNIE